MNGIVAHPRRQVNSRHSAPHRSAPHRGAPRRYHEPRKEYNLRLSLTGYAKLREASRRTGKPMSELLTGFIEEGLLKVFGIHATEEPNEVAPQKVVPVFEPEGDPVFEPEGDPVFEPEGDPAFEEILARLKHSHEELYKARKGWEEEEARRKALELQEQIEQMRSRPYVPRFASDEDVREYLLHEGRYLSPMADEQGREEWRKAQWERWKKGYLKKELERRKAARQEGIPAGIVGANKSREL